jgi:hypothetical protein
MQNRRMSSLRTSCAISISLLAAVSLHAADAALPGWFPPGTRVVIGLRVRSLVDALSAQGIAQEARQKISGFRAQTPLAGFDPFHDVDEILLASTAAGPNPPSLVVMTGRFDAAAFSSGGTHYRNAIILEGPRGSQQATALVDANTMLAGDPALVRAALDRGGRGAPIDPDLAARAAALRARYDIWGAGNPPPGVKLPAAGAESLESIDRFGFGVALAHGLECVADLHVRSPKDLEKLNSSLRLLEAMLKAQPAGGGEARFDLRTENGAIHASLSIPEEALKKTVAAQRASLASAVAAPRAAVATAPQPSPPRKAEIVRDHAGNTLSVMLPGNQ